MAHYVGEPGFLVWADAVDTTLGGLVIDTAESEESFDVKAVGTTATDVPGMSVLVPAGVGPFEVQFDGHWNITTGTATNATQGRIEMHITDYLRTTIYAKGYASMVQVSTSALAGFGPLRICTKTFDVDTVNDRVFVLRAKLFSAAPANWGQILLAAGDPEITPTDSFSVMKLKAVRTATAVS